MRFSAVQPEKAERFMLLSVSGSVTVVSAVQELKADIPICVTPSSMIISLRVALRMNE